VKIKVLRNALRKIYVIINKKAFEGEIMKSTTTIELTSDKLNIVQQDGYYLINFNDTVQQYYTSTKVENNLSVNVPKSLGTISGQGKLETVINKSLDHLATSQDISGPPKITLTIEKIEENKMIVSLLIMNNIETPISLPSVPYKIINSEGEELYKGTLVNGPYEANPNSYSKYIAYVEENINVNIQLEDYEIIFSH
jgi:hypothetical protein